MTNYEFLEDLKEKEYLKPLVNKGIIGTHILGWMKIYSELKIELKANSKGVAVQYIADKYKLTDRTIRNIIKFCETIA